MESNHGHTPKEDGSNRLSSPPSPITVPAVERNTPPAPNADTEDEVADLLRLLRERQEEVFTLREQVVEKKKAALLKKEEEAKARSRALEGKLQQLRKNKEKIHEKLTSLQVERKQRAQEDVAIEEDAWRPRFELSVEQLAFRRLELEKLRQQRQEMENRLKRHAIMVDSVESELKRRNVESVDEITAAIKKVEHWQAYVETGAAQERLAEILETGAPSEVVRRSYLSEIQAMRQQEFEAQQRRLKKERHDLNMQRLHLIERFEEKYKKAMHAITEEEGYLGNLDSPEIQQRLLKVSDKLKDLEQQKAKLREEMRDLVPQRPYEGELGLHSYTESQLETVDLVRPIVQYLIDRALRKAKDPEKEKERLNQELVNLETLVERQRAEEERHRRELQVPVLGTKVLNEVTEELMRSIAEEELELRSNVTNSTFKMLLGVSLEALYGEEGAPTGTDSDKFQQEAEEAYNVLLHQRLARDRVRSSGFIAPPVQPHTHSLRLVPYELLNMFEGEKGKGDGSAVQDAVDAHERALDLEVDITIDLGLIPGQEPRMQSVLRGKPSADDERYDSSCGLGLGPEEHAAWMATVDQERRCWRSSKVHRAPVSCEGYGVLTCAAARGCNGGGVLYLGTSEGVVLVFSIRGDQPPARIAVIQISPAGETVSAVRSITPIGYAGLFAVRTDDCMLRIGSTQVPMATEDLTVNLGAPEKLIRLQREALRSSELGKRLDFFPFTWGYEEPDDRDLKLVWGRFRILGAALLHPRKREEWLKFTTVAPPPPPSKRALRNQKTKSSSINASAWSLQPEGNAALDAVGIESHHVELDTTSLRRVRPQLVLANANANRIHQSLETAISQTAARPSGSAAGLSDKVHRRVSLGLKSKEAALQRSVLTMDTIARENAGRVFLCLLPGAYSGITVVEEFNPESITGNGSGLLVALSDGAVVFARPIPYKMGMGAPALLAAYRSRITTTEERQQKAAHSVTSTVTCAIALPSEPPATAADPPAPSPRSGPSTSAAPSLDNIVRGQEAAKALNARLFRYHKQPVVAVLRPAVIPEAALAALRGSEAGSQGPVSCRDVFLTVDAGGTMAVWKSSISDEAFGWCVPLLRVRLLLEINGHNRIHPSRASEVGLMGSDLLPEKVFPPPGVDPQAQAADPNFLRMSQQALEQLPPTRLSTITLSNNDRIDFRGLEQQQGNLVKVLVSRISSAGVLHSQHEEWLETVALEGVVLRAITNHARTQAILLVVYPPCEPMPPRMRVVIMDLRTLVVERPVVEIQYSGRDVPNMSATQVIEHLGSDYLLLAFDNHIKVLSLNTGTYCRAGIEINDDSKQKDASTSTQELQIVNIPGQNGSVAVFTPGHTSSPAATAALKEALRNWKSRLDTSPRELMLRRRPWDVDNSDPTAAIQRIINAIVDKAASESKNDA